MKQRPLLSTQSNRLSRRLQPQTVTAKTARAALKKLSSSKNAEVLKRFFKTGKGQYGEGDIFYGIKVPETRAVARLYSKLPLQECSTLLKAKVHEERLLALMIMGLQFRKGTEEQKKKIYSFYIKHLRYVNNWDLVDSSAHIIAGAYLFDKSREPLYRLARSQNLWEKRVAIIATFWFIRLNDFSDTLRISEILLDDEHDLIHKAVGWMLREVGKRDLKTEQKFLANHYKKMPRTMLRYAIEKFPEALRLRYLKGAV